MKYHKLLRLPMLLAAILLSLASCDLLFSVKKAPSILPPLEYGQFYAQNMVNKKYYIVTADRLHEGEYCVIWVEKGSGVTKKMAEEVGDEFDNNIRSLIVDTYSEKNFSVTIDGKMHSFKDVLDMANFLGDGEKGENGEDGKLTILLLDIKDGYNPNTSPGSVAGYFFGGNYFEKGPVYDDPYAKKNILFYSNGRDMIYIDTYPSLDKDNMEDMYATFAHELQHLINFYTTLFARDYYLMDTWIDEGLSSQAEYLYLKKHVTWKCEWFAEDPGGTIANGNNFYIWDNYEEEWSAQYDDYSTVYLFFRWLFLQSGQEKSLFYRIANSEKYDFRAVTELMGMNWETLLRRWFAANYNPADPDYGYKGDGYLQGLIKVKTIPGSSIKLYPGEGVYSVIRNSVNRTPTTGNIKYAGLTANSSNIITSSPYSGEVLLTFNANTDNYDDPEIGNLTNVAPPASAARSAAGETQTWQFTGPRVLDARDVMGRDQITDIQIIPGRPPIFKVKDDN